MTGFAIRNALALFAALAATTLVPVAASAAGDIDKGEAIYAKRCIECHGEEGDGLGPGADRLNPPPRDFTLGLFKFKTSSFDADLPNDADIRRMIRDGMPGTAMPAWGGMLGDQDIEDVLAYIKTFAELEGEPEGQTDFGTQVASSPESIARGRELFHENDRCAECHGQDGKGDAIKKLKDDNGDRTWPRNLTKPWIFRASNDPKDIFARISTGIPTTQMPSFADPSGKKSLSIEDRWHVANYVASLAKRDLVVNPENTVVQANRAVGALPVSPDDEAWQTTPPTTFMMVPQLVASERFFTTANDTISVRALFDDEAIAIYLEWDDRTKSIPGDEKAASIAAGELFEDAVAVQLPQTAPEGMEKPYFIMGDAVKPVTLWRWSSGGTDTPESATLIDAAGVGAQVPREGDGGLHATGSYTNGTWRVVMTRALRTDNPDGDLQLSEGQIVPVSFFAWDGSNGETGTAHAMTTWYWLLLKPAPSSRPVVYGVLAALAAFGLLVWWGRAAARRSRGDA